jgi:hypothetical protein
MDPDATRLAKHIRWLQVQDYAWIYRELSPAVAEQSIRAQYGLDGPHTGSRVGGIKSIGEQSQALRKAAVRAVT